MDTSPGGDQRVLGDPDVGVIDQDLLAGHADADLRADQPGGNRVADRAEPGRREPVDLADLIAYGPSPPSDSRAASPA